MDIIFWTTLGFAFIIIDILVIPGSLLVLAGSGLIIYGVYLNYEANGPILAALHLMACMAAVPYILIKGFKRMALKEEMHNRDGFVGVEDRSGYVGMHGVAKSTLRPAGTVVVLKDSEEIFLDCVAEGGMIEKGEPVIILEDRGTSLIVRKLEESQSPSAAAAEQS